METTSEAGFDGTDRFGVPLGSEAVVVLAERRACSNSASSSLRGFSLSATDEAVSSMSDEEESRVSKSSSRACRAMD